MMIVVPGSTEGDQREKKMAAAAILCVIRAMTKTVGQGGDGEHAQGIEKDGGPHGDRNPNKPEKGHDGKIHLNERNGA